ncbi:hypothetical protein [Photobacterium nomapromontoriensis]|uniref:hypothetical protein n=1 Tax=Photobacterium nomapromontoriensis TaxID=2910237 RepID=UPI003D09B14B
MVSSLKCFFGVVIILALIVLVSSFASLFSDVSFVTINGEKVTDSETLIKMTFSAIFSIASASAFIHFAQIKYISRSKRLYKVVDWLERLPLTNKSAQAITVVSVIAVFVCKQYEIVGEFTLFAFMWSAFKVFLIGFIMLLIPIGFHKVFNSQRVTKFICLFFLSFSTISIITTSVSLWISQPNSPSDVEAPMVFLGLLVCSVIGLRKWTDFEPITK